MSFFHLPAGRSKRYSGHAMRPIRFICREFVPLTPEEIAARILDVSNWQEFKGYGPLPGIRTAEFEVRTTDIAGSRIRVTSTDGSTYVEEIVEWQPGRHAEIHMKDFSPPLSRLAISFTEKWDFVRLDRGTQITRSFEMHATSFMTRPVLWLIARLLKRAIVRHLHQMQK